LSVRGPFFVLGSVLLFALTIRGVDFGLFKFPALGLIVAGPQRRPTRAKLDPTRDDSPC
jgi:hypothetical protein